MAIKDTLNSLAVEIDRFDRDPSATAGNLNRLLSNFSQEIVRLKEKHVFNTKLAFIKHTISKSIYTKTRPTVLKSGQHSNTFIDLGRVTCVQRYREDIGSLMYEQASKEIGMAEGLAGPISGACLIMAEMQKHYKYDCGLIRLKMNGYEVDTSDISSVYSENTLLLVDDVLTTGQSLTACAKALKSRYKIIGAITVVNRSKDITNELKIDDSLSIPYTSLIEFNEEENDK